MVESRERRGAEVQETWEEERGKEFLQGQEMKVTFQPLSAVDLCYKNKSVCHVHGGAEQK